MPNRSSRKLLRNHNDKEMAQQQAINKRYECQPAGKNHSADAHSSSGDHVIADIAKSFAQLQAQTKSVADSDCNQELLTLLEKLNKQMENIQKLIANEQPSQVSGVQTQQPGSYDQERVLQMLNQYLQNSQQTAGSDTAGSLSGQASNNQNQTQQQKQSPAGRITAKTAQEMLAKAQYELSNELEASLTKLKQVIQESEQVVSKVSSLLGEKNTQS